MGEGFFIGDSPRMREYLNAILAFIVAESLTDEEYATVTATMPILDQDTYGDLARILASRETLTDYQERLVSFYKAKGVDVTPLETAKSNILLGLVL